MSIAEANDALRVLPAWTCKRPPVAEVLLLLYLHGLGPYPRFVDTGCDYAAVGSVAPEVVP